MYKFVFFISDIVFPVLDILRLAIRHQSINTLVCSKELSPKLIKLLETFINQNNSIKTNQMLALRVLTNMFNHETGEALALQNQQQFLSTVSNFQTDDSKTQVNFLLLFCLQGIVTSIKNTPKLQQILVEGILTCFCFRE